MCSTFNLSVVNVPCAHYLLKYINIQCTYGSEIMNWFFSSFPFFSFFVFLVLYCFAGFLVASFPTVTSNSSLHIHLPRKDIV